MGEEMRATGRTTRLIDKYIQALFNNRGEWVEIRDHVDNNTAHRHLLRRVTDRLWSEHNRHLPLETDYTHFKLKLI